jgi:ADP-ribose pyrophosphatase YjhB (NUDIX family)
VTLFILDPSRRLALIRKPHFALDVWRPPGGGIKPGEDATEAAKREALEETGLHVQLRRYLVEADAVFRNGGRELPWTTHVLLAETEDTELAPNDPVEIADARWGTLEELAGPLREILLATGRAFWRYRAALHDAALGQLEDLRDRGDPRA